MKILFIISTLKMGGAERVCAALASKFSQSHEVVLAKFDESEPFYEINKNVKVLNLAYGASDMGMIKNFKKRFSKILALRELVKFGELKKAQNSSKKCAKFDAVISFLDSTNILSIIALMGLKTPIIISEHTSFDAPKPFLLKPLKRLFYPRANALSVLSKSDFLHYKNYCANVKVIYNPLFLKGALNNEKKENIVLFVGRLERLKNCEAFIRVAANLKHNDIKFLILGDGSEKTGLKKLANELNARVEFVGNALNISEFYAKAKILLSTSIVEGFGNVLIESAAFNVARIASKTSGACELITDKKDGILCEQTDIKTMSEAVLDLIKNETKRDEICKNARENLEKFSLENIYNQWLELLKTAGVKI